VSSAWSWYVIALVVLNIVGCVWLLWWTGRRKPGDPGPEDISHIWDGDLTEYNKPMPRWWINMFYLTIVYGIGYLIWYPGMGLFPGVSGWSSAREHDADKATRDLKLEASFSRFHGEGIDALANDPQALKLGQSIFANTCATCHGSTAQGAIGFPNLADGNWQWGGEPEQVLASVLDGRQAAMPGWGAVLQGMGGDQAVDYVVAYVRTLSTADQSLSNDFFAARGKPMFNGVCAACHGTDGKGNVQIGAPDLTDGYWLYGSSRDSLRQTIIQGRHGQMPAQREALGDTRARLVAAYVWSLSHKPAAGAP